MRWMGCCWWWHHGGKWCQRSISAHFNALTRGTDGWYLLGGECAKCFVYQVRMCRHHVLPADSFHHVCSVTAVDDIRENQSILIDCRHWLENLRVDEVNRLRFKLISTVEIGEYQRFSCCFYWQVNTQRLFAHHFKLLQGILKGNRREGCTTVSLKVHDHRASSSILTLSAAASKSSAIFSKFGAFPV